MFIILHCCFLLAYVELLCSILNAVAKLVANVNFIALVTLVISILFHLSSILYCSIFYTPFCSEPVSSVIVLGQIGVRYFSFLCSMVYQSDTPALISLLIF